jgi:hypothetical protein
MNGDDELSLKDITFLRAIRDINGSPERYASTEQGVTPATVTAITEATTLSEEEVAYRLDHPRLGKSGLVNVYEAGPPGDDSASLNSAELTKSGERAIAEAEDRESSVGAEEWRPDQEQSEFDDMQEWEPAEVESGNDTARADAGGGASAVGGAAAHASADPTVAPATEAPEPMSTNTGSEPASTEASADDDRLAALEERIEQLEAETAEADADSEPARSPRTTSAEDASVEELSEEVAALRETTDRLESTLEDALDDLDEIRESETGALDEKREQQFETAVKSMVAFHQLATEVLDVRVENYEPSAGRADHERVETTRNRIGDALGVGQSGGSGGGGSLEMDDDGSWPDPEEAAAGGCVCSGDDGEDDATPEQESDASDSGVYPPIGGDNSAREAVDDTEDGEVDDPDDESDAPDSGVYPPIGESESGEEGDATDDESDAPDTGIYPPIGEDRDDEPADGGSDGAELPASIRPDTDAAEENITETAAAEGHVVDPIRSTGDPDVVAGGLPLDLDPEAVLSLRRVVAGPDGDGGRVETTDGTEDVDGTDEDPVEPWLLGDIDPSTVREVRESVMASSGQSERSATEDAYPEGEAYARIADEPSASRASTPTVDGSGPDHAPADDDD